MLSKENVNSYKNFQYECKARGIKKQRVVMTISVDGVKVSVQRRGKGVVSSTM